jgi:hypothetical protein
MPIAYKIYHDQQLVVTQCRGHLTGEEMFEYQQGAWSRPEISGYNELVDLSEVVELVAPRVNKARELADLSASMDDPGKASRFAIVAVTELQFAMGRMYTAWRNSDHRTSKQAQVFRSRPEALDWLGLKGMPPDDGNA